MAKSLKEDFGVLQVAAALGSGRWRFVSNGSSGGPRLVPRVACGGGQVGAQALHGVIDRAAHLVGKPAHGVRDLVLDTSELGLALAEFGPTGVGDGVDGLASVCTLADEPLLLELR